MTAHGTSPQPARHRLLPVPSMLRALAVAVAWCVTISTAHAQTSAAQRNSGRVPLAIPGQPAAPKDLYEGSYALLVGASAYRNGWKPLPGVKTDIPPVKEALEKHGFSVQVVMDPTRDQLDAALRNFVAQHGQKEGNRLLVYFAGHGESLEAKAGGKLGYIVPVDAPLPQADLAGFKRMAYSMDAIEGHARQMDVKHALFVFDSCFSGTIFAKRANVPDSITDKTSRPVRQFISSGDAGQTVPDESKFRKRFVRALLDGDADLNRDHYITGSELGSYLEDSVTNDTRRTQTPRHGKIMREDLDQGDFVFASLRVEPTPAPPPPPRPVQTDAEQETWELAKRRDTVAAYQAYLDAYPQGRYATPAHAALAGLRPAAAPAPQPPSAPSPAPAPATQTSNAAQAGQVFKDCQEAHCPEMVIIPAGRFTMGSSDGDADEKPPHSVNVRSFAMGKYEVTQGQWKAVMGSNPSRFSNCGDNCPVEKVSWDDIQQYIQKLNQKTGQQYRLPSEAEWEYAARAGSTGKWSFGDNESALGQHAWYSANSNSQTRPVGQKQANAFNLHDMHGNVWEWVQDVGHDNYSGAPTDGSAWVSGGDQSRRVLRGGSWISGPGSLRSANRDGISPDFRSNYNGFRIARTVP